MRLFFRYPMSFINIKPFTLRTGEQLLDLSKPKIMGILNVTPDSFFDGGRHYSLDGAMAHAHKLVRDGADIIDIGGYSSRPGAAHISAQEELDRIVPVVEALVAAMPGAILSIDTFRAAVARATVEAGAHIINDISGGTLDEAMFETVAQLNVPYILMHTRGTPQTMQQQTDYHNIVEEIALYFGERISRLRSLGLADIILDPGFGFAKSLAQNYELLAGMDTLHAYGLPILGAVSRKSMIYTKLGIAPAEALNGTTVIHTLLLNKGVHLLRVHDVKEAREVVRLMS